MIQILTFALIGAFLSRWHGGGWGTPSPRWIKNILCAAPFTLQSMLLGQWGVTVIAFGLSLAAIATGHGRGQSLKEPLTGDPEEIEVVTSWAIPYLPTYWYKVFILFVSGLCIASGGVFASIMCGNYTGTALIALGGAMKPVAYMIGWKIYPKQEGNKGLPYLSRPTEIGEFLSGFFVYGALAYAMF